MIEGKLNLQNAMDGIDSYFPDDMKKDTVSAFENCKDIAHVENCEAAYLLSECLLKEHPTMFFL